MHAALYGEVQPPAAAGCHPVRGIADEDHAARPESVRNLGLCIESADALDGDRNVADADTPADRLQESVLVLTRMVRVVEGQPWSVHPAVGTSGGQKEPWYRCSRRGVEPVPCVAEDRLQRRP